MQAEDSVDRCTEHLFHWQYSRSDSFSAKLFMLMQKADGNNQQRLMLAFPNHFEAWRRWHQADDASQYFSDLGFKFLLSPREMTEIDQLAKGNAT